MAARPAPLGPGDPRLGLTVTLAMLVLVVADAQQHEHARAGRRDRRRLRDCRRAHPAAGAADDLRPQRASGRGRARSPTTPSTRRWRAHGHLAAGRRQGAAGARPRPWWSRWSRSSPGALGLLAWKVDYSTTTLLQEVGGQRRGLQGPRASAFPQGTLAPDDRARRARGRPGHARPTSPRPSSKLEGGGRGRERRPRPGSRPRTAASPRSTGRARGRPAQGLLARPSARPSAMRSRTSRRA